MPSSWKTDGKRVYDSAGPGNFVRVRAFWKVTPGADLRFSLPIRIHLLLFGLAVLLPQLIVGGLVGTWYAAGERARLRESAVTAASSIRARLDRELDAMTASLEVLATSPHIDSGDLGAFYQQATDVLRHRGSAIAMRDASHQQVMNTYVPWGTPLPVSKHPVLVAADEAVFSTRRPVVSDLYVGAVAKAPFVLVDVPVIREGRVIYALNMAVSPAALGDLVFATALPGDWIGAVVDGHDIVVARSREADRFVGAKAPIAFTERTEPDRGTLTGVIALDGTPVFAAFEKSALSSWHVTVSVPEAIMAQPARNLVWLLLAFTALATTVSAAVAYAYARRVSGDMLTLGSQAAALGRGDDTGKPGRSVQEIAELSDTLTAVDAELHDRAERQALLMSELNHRVRNTLSIVQGLIHGSRRDAGDRDEVIQGILGRVLVLGRAQALLSASGWGPIDLADAVRAATEGELPVRFRGSATRLKAESVVPLLQVLHELAAIAARPGEVRTRPVEVDAELRADGGLDLLWTDPAPIAEEERSAYGAVLLRRLLEQQLGGRGTHLVENGNLCFRMSLPPGVLEPSPPDSVIEQA